MAQDQIEEIKRKIDIVELISEYVPLKRAGRNFKGLCPFHSEKTPSFMVSPELQIFKCFGCQAGGDCYKFLTEYEKIDFGQALKVLADRVGVKLKPLRGFTSFTQKEEIYKVNHQAAQFYHYLLVAHSIGEPARLYLKDRGVRDESIKTFKLGFAPDRPDTLFKFLTEKRKTPPELAEKAGLVVRRQTQHFDRFRARIMFPLGDHYGNILGFSGRVIKDEGDIAKYINSPDTLVYKKGETLYGLDITKQDIKKAGESVVVEGEFDLISSWQAGIRNIVAIKGSALTEEQAELLSRFCQSVHLALDADIAGDAAARRGIEVLQKKSLTIKVVDLGGAKDPDQAAQKNPSVFRKAVKTSKGIYDFLVDSAFDKFDPSTAEGKEKLSFTLLPILASIDNEIIKAHFVKVVAGKLGVSEEVVRLETNKQAKSKMLPSLVQTQGKGEDEAPRRQVLEQRLLSIIFQTNAQLFADGQIYELVAGVKANRLVEEFKRYYKAHNGSFDVSDFANQLPAELVDFFASLLMTELPYQGQLDTEREIRQIIQAIQVLTAHQRIKELTTKMKLLEQQDQQDQLRQAGVQLDVVVKRLAELEAS